MKFKLFSKNELLGESYLEYGDPPMGVAFGELCPTESYFVYQDIFQRRDFDEIKRLNLFVISDSGVKLEAVGGISIDDYSKEMGEQSIHVNVLGVDASQYNQFFPEHVEKYEAQFK